jgi:predicted nucleotidyltransferase
MTIPVGTTALCPTPYPAVNSVLSELVEGVVGILGAKLVSTCLQGSFAVGDFDENSDVDFVVTTREEIDEETVDALQLLHARIFDLECQWAQHLEGSYFTADVLRSCARQGEELWYLDNGSRELIRSKHCNTPVVRQIIREHGLWLAGAEPATLVDPIPIDLLREGIRVKMCDWARDILENPTPWRNRFYQGFIVLQYCRMWRDWTTGTIGSKRRGAAWAKTRLDARRGPT